MEKDFLNELVAFRRELHQYPELSGHEFETRFRIEQMLDKLGVQNMHTVGETGMLAVFDSGNPGPVLLFRADTDALPIDEINTFDHVSVRQGVSHMCGHDGHTAVLCGLAGYLVNNPVEYGKVALLFQPAEENGEGARAVLEDPAFTITPDFVFAFHNLPEYPMHQVVWRTGSFNAAAKSIIISLHGKTAHAAQPADGINPATAVAKLVQMFSNVSVPDTTAPGFRLATPIFMELGTRAYGVSAGDAEVHYTLRTWDNAAMALFVLDVQAEIERICVEEGLRYELRFTEEFDSCKNDEKAVELVMQAADNNGLAVVHRPVPFKWGEDFGLFTERFKGAMFGIGAGEDCPALHNPDYDFPDQLIETGIKMFDSIIRSVK